MKESIRQRLEKLSDRFEEVGRLLASDEVAGGSSQFRDLSMEYARLAPLAERYRAYRGLERDLRAAADMAADADPGMRALGAEEAARVRAQIGAAEEELRRLLLPKDPRDEKNLFLEVRAGTGGDEAAIFAGELYRMYARYAESKGLTRGGAEREPGRARRLQGDHQPHRRPRARISLLKFESGTHRVQRVPATEAQGRIHTSAVTVAILPEPDEVGEIELEAGGPAHRHLPLLGRRRPARQQDRLGGAHHAPAERHRGGVPGRALAAQEPRPRHGAAQGAAARRRARRSSQCEQAQSRRLQVGSGDRSERIRTYNFPQGRVTDHRIDLTLYKLAQVMDGELDELVRALQQEHQARAARGRGVTGPRRS